MSTNKKITYNSLEKYLYNLDNNTPILFNKKSKIIQHKPLKYIRNDTGKSRHFTPAAQEWFNSVYHYNANNIKSLAVADKNLMNLLKSYFNSYPSKKLYNIKTKRMAMRFKRLSTKKVFVGKGELKHTSSKIIITFYLYNTERMFLLNKLRKLEILFFRPLINLKRFKNKDRDGNIKITYNRRFTKYEYPFYSHQYEGYISSMTVAVNKLTSSIGLINTYYENLTNLVEKNLLSEQDKLKMFNDKVKNIKTFNYTHLSPYLEFSPYVEKNVSEYWKELKITTQLLKIKNSLIDDEILSSLILLAQKLYNKKVIFNIVNLRKMHLNSDIFTQAVSLKLRNRDNKLYRVLKSSLRKVKVPIMRKIEEKKNKPDKDKFFVNRIRNKIISSMFNYKVKDPLSNLLLNFFPSSDDLKVKIKKKSSIKTRPITLISYVLKSLKHLKLRGIRVEAKGRLTRRFTASRSVFKMKWKGGLKNVDSSFRGLSAIMLRGIFKSNVQYSVISSKNRNGAFGVKGWVSSK